MSERTASPRRAAGEPRPSLSERLQSRGAGSTSGEQRTATRPAVPAAPDAPSPAATGATSTAAPAAKSRTTPGRSGRKAPRRARLRLTRIDPWSVMKTAFLLSIAFGVVTFVAIFMVWSVLGAAGVWDSINSAVASIVEGDNNRSSFDVTDYVGMSRVLGFTLLVSVVDVILITALATLSAFLYNLSAALLGGIELTLAEDDR